MCHEIPNSDGKRFVVVFQINFSVVYQVSHNYIGRQLLVLKQTFHPLLKDNTSCTEIVCYLALVLRYPAFVVRATTIAIW